MKETTRQLFARALDAIEAAEILATNGKVDFAAGRAYYAMFILLKPCSMRKVSNSANMETSLPPTDSILQKRVNWTQSFTAGCLPPSIKGRSGITLSTLISRLVSSRR